MNKEPNTNKTFQDVRNTSNEATRFLSELEGSSSIQPFDKSVRRKVISQNINNSTRKLNDLYSPSKKRNQPRNGSSYNIFIFFAILVALSHVFHGIQFFIALAMIAFVIYSVKAILK